MVALIFKPDRADPKPVVVRWLDTHVHLNENWTKIEDFVPDEGLVCHSVGYLVHNDKKSVILSQSLGGDTYDNLITIPKGCVEEIIHLVASKGRGR